MDINVKASYDTKIFTLNLTLYRIDFANKEIYVGSCSELGQLYVYYQIWCGSIKLGGMY